MSTLPKFQKAKEKEEPEEENEEENEEAVDCVVLEDEIEDYDEDYDEDEDNDEDGIDGLWHRRSRCADDLGILFAQIRQYEPYTKEEEVAFQELNKYVKQKRKVAILRSRELQQNRKRNRITQHTRLVVKYEKGVA